jgi:hypothetical protein
MTCGTARQVLNQVPAVKAALQTVRSVSEGGERFLDVVREKTAAIADVARKTLDKLKDTIEAQIQKAVAAVKAELDKGVTLVDAAATKGANAVKNGAKKVTDAATAAKGKLDDANLEPLDGGDTNPADGGVDLSTLLARTFGGGGDESTATFALDGDAFTKLVDDASWSDGGRVLTATPELPAGAMATSVEMVRVLSDTGDQATTLVAATDVEDRDALLGALKACQATGGGGAADASAALGGGAAVSGDGADAAAATVEVRVRFRAPHWLWSALHAAADDGAAGTALRFELDGAQLDLDAAVAALVQPLHAKATSLAETEVGERASKLEKKEGSSRELRRRRLGGRAAPRREVAVRTVSLNNTTGNCQQQQQQQKRR